MNDNKISINNNLLVKTFKSYLLNIHFQLIKIEILELFYKI